MSSVKPAPVFDLKEHLRIVHRQVLPLFFFIAAIATCLFVLLRLRDQGPRLPDGDFLPARIGLLRPKPPLAFDPAFAVLTPREMVLAPRATRFDPPLAPSPEGEEASAPVLAAADGLVLQTGSSGEGGDFLVLLHDRAGSGIVASVYQGISGVRVPVGALVRRGQPLARTDRSQDLFRFELRRLRGLETGGPDEGTKGRLGGEELLSSWRGRDGTSLAPPPEGDRLEDGAFQLEVGPPPQPEAPSPP